MQLPGGVLVTGEGENTATLSWGWLKLPVSHQQRVGWLLICLAAAGSVALGAYVCRDRIRNAFGHLG